jgi:hypothetical protein
MALIIRYVKSEYQIGKNGTVPVEISSLQKICTSTWLKG